MVTIIKKFIVIPKHCIPITEYKSPIYVRILDTNHDVILPSKKHDLHQSINVARSCLIYKSLKYVFFLTTGLS